MSSAEPSNKELNEMWNFLETLRNPSKGKSFAIVVEEKWKELGMQDEANPALFEDIIIQVVEKLYNHNNSKLTDKELRKRAKRHDISLLMFGLLDGYYHTKIVGNGKENVAQAERYEQYLHKGDFVKLDYSGQGSYEEIKEATRLQNKQDKSYRQPKPLNALIHIAGECKKEICPALTELIQSGNYEKSTNATFDKETGQRVDLPKPAYTLKSFSQKGAKGSDRGKTYPSGMPNKRPIRAVVIIVGIFLGICLVAALLMFLLFGEAYIRGGHSDIGGKIGSGYNNRKDKAGEVQNDLENQTNWTEWGFSFRGPFAGENNK